MVENRPLTDTSALPRQGAPTPYEGRILAALRKAGVAHRRGGLFVQIPATWRGGRNANVSISLLTGDFWDFKVSDKKQGDFNDLCRLLGIQPVVDGCHEPAPSPDDIKKMVERDVSTRAKWATRIWTQADTISRVESDLESQHRTHFGGRRVSKSLDHNYLISQKTAAMSYLASRGMAEFARQSGARISVSERGGELVPWSVVWPIHVIEYRPHDLTPATPRVAISRESGRGHAAKRMLGPAKRGFFATPSLIPNSRIVVFGEGTATTCAVRRFVGCAAVTLFTAGNLAGIDPGLVRLLAPQFDEFIIAADNDRYAEKLKRHPGQHAANVAALAILEVLGSQAGKSVMIATPRDEGTDWADVADRLGDTAAADLFRRAMAPPVLPSLDRQTLDRASHLPSLALASTAWCGTRGAAAPPGAGSDPHLPDPASVDVAAGHLQAEMSRALTALMERSPDRSTPPTPLTPSLFVATTGLGKTSTMTAAIGREMPASPLLISTPRVEDRDTLAADIAAASAGQIIPHVHHGRSAENCLIFAESVKAIQDAARSPSPWVCASCEHGSADAPTPCGYMVALRSSMASRVVVTTHSAIGDDSSLLDFSESGEKIRRRLIIDESIVRHKIVQITTEMIAAACMQRSEACRRLDQIKASAEMSRQDLQQRGDHVLAAKVETELSDINAALAWIPRTIGVLERLATALGGSVGKPRILLTGDDWADLATLGRTIPRFASLHDGTVIESVQIARKQNLAIPSSWVGTLATAVAAGTAWLTNGVVVAGHDSALYRRWLDSGGLLLDATPNLRVEHDVQRRGGTIYRVRAPEPIRYVQYGPTVHGRGRLGNPSVRARLANELIDLMDAASAEGKVVAAITHKPVGQLAARTRSDLADWIGWWGRDEKAHNRWSGVDVLILHGLPIPAPDVSYHEYALDQAAMGGTDWDGTVERGAIVELDGDRWMRSAVPLPTEPTARSWLIDKWTADAAQAAGRLRACRSDRTVECRIYGAVPLQGHGVVVDDFVTEPGRTRTRAAVRYAIAAAIQDDRPGRRRSRAATRARLAELGLTPSNATIDKVAAEIVSAALHSGRSIDDELGTVVRYFESLLSGQDGWGDPAGEAQLAALRSADSAEAARWRATAAIIGDTNIGGAQAATAPVWPGAPPTDQRSQKTD